jgi:hypothetical protein
LGTETGPMLTLDDDDDDDDDGDNNNKFALVIHRR